jgi:hypothetical protein
MLDWFWIVVLLIVVAALVYGAFMLGRSLGSAEARHMSAPPVENTSEAAEAAPREAPRRTAAPPPAQAAWSQPKKGKDE